MKPSTRALTMNRRQFLARAAASSAAFMAPALVSAAAARRTAADRVELGQTGLKISRLGMGTGSQGGRVQQDLGQDAFVRLVREAYDRGITYLDCAKNYKTLPWIGDAIAGLPRDKIFLLTKIGGKPENPAQEIDDLLTTYRTDYVDCLMVHCMVKDTWTDDMKRLMDAIDEAKAKGKIRCNGVSCHTLPALKIAAESDWVEVNLIRVNPQAAFTDRMTLTKGEEGTIDPVMDLIRVAHQNRHGILGMKLIGNGDFVQETDRETAMRFAMSHPEIDAVTIGFKNTAEMDEAIERMNRALRETAV